MVRLFRSSSLWFSGLVVWCATLWYISSTVGSELGMPPVFGIDKVYHFGYFFGGGRLLTGSIFYNKSLNFSWKSLYILNFVFFICIACLDEYHQSMTAGRSGNDLYDGLADLLGALFGVYIFKKLHPLLK